MADQECSEVFDSNEDAAAYFALESWKSLAYAGTAPSYPIWSQSKGDQAVVVLGRASNSPERVVLCTRNAKGWLATGWGHPFEVIKFGEPDHGGVCAYCWRLATQATGTARVVCRGEEVQAPIIDGHAYYAHWSSDKGTKETSWGPGEFCVYLGDRLVWDAATQPTWLSHILATAKDFADAHYRYYCKELEEDWWAVDRLSILDSREEKLDAVRCLIDAVTDFREQKDYLYRIGAGPLEDLMSDWLLDQLAAEISDQRLLTALSCVRMDSEPVELQERLQKLVRPFLSSVDDTYLDAQKIWPVKRK